MPHDADIDDQWFDGLARAILAPEPPKSFEALGGDAAAKDSVRLDAGVRVYRNNVRSAYSRVLAAAFPAVKRIVGDEFFTALAQEYFKEHTPRSPLVARYGDVFPAFLETFEPVTHLAYLPDVARLEILWLAAYHAADAKSLTAAEALAAAGAAPDAASLTLHPSLRLFSSQHPAVSIWLHNHMKREAPLTLKEGGEQAFIVRPKGEVRVTPTTPAVYTCLEALSGGAALGPAVEAALDVDATAEPPAILHTIFDAGAVTAVTPGS